ncbi:MAG: ATP-binding protein [Thalassotalea sp.]
MFTSIKNILCGISVKLFFWFWLVIVSSVLITYFITLQFSDSTSIYAPNKYSKKILTKTSRQLMAAETFNINKVQKKFLKGYGGHLIFKDLITNKIYLPEGIQWKKVKDYLAENEFVNQASVEFSITRITGPQLFTFENQTYHLFMATDNINQKFHFFMKQFPIWLRLLVLIIISFLFCWLLARNISKPLINIQAAAHSFGKGDLSVRLNEEIDRHDEFGALATSFNIMASKLESNINAHQRLLGDVSHEFRSPLTRLQLALALVEKAQNSPTEQKKHLERCEKAIDQLDNMISDVLTLSRLEHATQKINQESINLYNLIESIVDDCQFVANQKKVKINLFEPQQLLINADAKLLDSAISNILNNAVKYAPEDSEIDVKLKKDNYTIYLSVSDQGSGVPEETLSKLFKAFYRVTDARDRKSGGTGLGLAIAHQAIELHKGKIYARNNTDQGLTVYIELPLT